MTGTPPLSEQLPRINKFVGEAFEEKAITRTIFVSSEEDTTKKESRVILLIGPQTARKTSLIDFLCNYFYGAELDQPTRYHIANEKFDSTTPEKQIITYVFNDAKMDFRPVVIDTPSTSGPHGEENRRLLEDWLKDNKMKIDAIGIVFSAHSRLTSTEEEGLQKALQLIPPHLAEKRIVFMTGSDGSSPPVGLLRRLNLDRADVYKVNTSCIFQRPEDDPLQEHLRGNYWRMSVTNFEALFSRLKYEQPLSHLIRRYDIPPAESLESTQSSQDTFVQLFKGTSDDSARKPFDVLQNTTTENSVSPEKSDSRMSSKASDRVREISTEEAITTLSGGSTTATRRLPDAKMTEQRSSLSSSAFVPPGNASKLKAWSHLDTRGSVGGATATTNGITSSLPSAAATDPSHVLQPQLESSTVTRYVYEVSSKSHKNHYVGPGSVEDPSATSRKIGSSTRTSRETTIDDPYYPPTVLPTGTTSTGRHSLYEFDPATTTISSASNHAQRKRPTETLIDFRSENIPSETKFSRHEPIPYFSLPRSRSADPIDTAARREAVLDIRRNPDYILSARQYQNVPISLAGNQMNREGDIPKYTAIMKASTPKHEGQNRNANVENVRMRNRDEPYRERDAAKRGSGPPYVRYGLGIGAIPLYDQPPDENMDGNEFVNSEHMRPGQHPMVQVQVKRKPNAQGSITSHQYNDSDYGDDWGDETRIVHRVDNTHPFPQLVEEVYRSRHYPGSAEKQRTSGDPTSITRPSYIPLPPAPQSPAVNIDQGGRNGMQYGGAGTRQTMGRNEMMPVQRTGVEYGRAGADQQNVGRNGITTAEMTGVGYGEAGAGQQNFGRNGIVTMERTGVGYGEAGAGQTNVGRNGIVSMERTGMGYGDAEAGRINVGRDGIMTMERTGVEYGGAEARLLNDGRSGVLTGKKITTTTTSTKRQPFQIRILRWTPSNCSNSRDCCLNCLFFVVVPLVILVIVAIIVLLIIFS